MPVRQPSKSTLAKYGLSLADWQLMLARQKGRCGICGKEKEYLVIDHEHPPISVWRKMPPKERRKLVRRLLCAWCNGRTVPDYNTLDILRGAVRYMAAYQKRKAKWLKKSTSD